MSAPGAQALWLERLDEAANFTRWVGEEIRPFLRGRVLEVGCGSGTYTDLLARSCEAVVGIDLDPAFAAAARRRFAEHRAFRSLKAMPAGCRISGGSTRS